MEISLHAEEHLAEVEVYQARIQLQTKKAASKVQLVARTQMVLPHSPLRTGENRLHLGNVQRERAIRLDEWHQQYEEEVLAPIAVLALTGLFR